MPTRYISFQQQFSCLKSLKLLVLHLSACDTQQGSTMAVRSMTLTTCASPATDIKLVSKQLFLTEIRMKEQRTNSPRTDLKVGLLASSRRAVPEPSCSNDQTVSSSQMRHSYSQFVPSDALHPQTYTSVKSYCTRPIHCHSS